MKELKQEVISCIVYENINEFIVDIGDRKNPFYSVRSWKLHIINNNDYYQAPHSYKKPYRVLKKEDYLKIMNICHINYKIHKEVYLSSYSNDEEGNTYYISKQSTNQPTIHEFIDSVKVRVNSDIQDIQDRAIEDVAELESVINNLELSTSTLYSITMNNLRELKE